MRLHVAGHWKSLVGRIPQLKLVASPQLDGLSKSLLSRARRRRQEGENKFLQKEEPSNRVWVRERERRTPRRTACPPQAADSLAR